jgi:hypothetical protein
MRHRFTHVRFVVNLRYIAAVCHTPCTFLSPQPRRELSNNKNTQKLQTGRRPSCYLEPSTTLTNLTTELPTCTEADRGFFSFHDITQPLRSYRHVKTHDTHLLYLPALYRLCDPNRTSM